MITRVWTAASAVGGRDENEDAWAARHGSSTARDGDHAVAVLCDGMGGHEDGAVASYAAAEAFLRSYEKRRGGSAVRDWLHAGVEAANAGVASARRDWSRMGTTLVAAVLTDAGVEWISVGDSPLYVWRASTNTLEAINPRHHLPNRPNELTSALMGDPIEEIAASGEPVAAAAGDLVILASDGLDTLGDDLAETVRAEAQSGDGPAMAGSLVDATLAVGKKRQDNVTAVTAAARLPRSENRRGEVRGQRTPDGPEVSVDGRPLDWERSLHVANHSPSGIEWGYPGSGPAQLALAVLMTVTNEERAARWYRRFQDEHFTCLQEASWAIRLPAIEEWLEAAEADVR